MSEFIIYFDRGQYAVLRKESIGGIPLLEPPALVGFYKTFDHAVQVVHDLSRRPVVIPTEQA